VRARLLIPLGLALAACVVVACLWITAPMDTEARAAGCGGIVDLVLLGPAALDSAVSHTSRATQHWVECTNEHKQWGRGRFKFEKPLFEKPRGAPGTDSSLSRQDLKVLWVYGDKLRASADSAAMDEVNAAHANEARLRDLLARAHRVTLTAGGVAFVALMGFLALALNDRRASGTA
jgi:hypothetical protein